MSKTTPLITLAVPVYNCGQTLPRCLDSLLAQSIQDFEIIICDNHSIDETVQIAQEYAARDSRITYVRHERNRGFSYNYNHLISLARGRYFMCTGAKDWRPADSIALGLAPLEADTGLVLCYGKTIGTDGVSEYAVVSDDLDSRNLTATKRFEKVVRNMFRGDTIYSMIRLEALRRTRLLRNAYAHDHIMIAELAAQGAFIHLQEHTLIRCEPLPTNAGHRNITQTLRGISPEIGTLHLHDPYQMMRFEHLLALWHSPLPLHKKFTLSRRTLRILRDRFIWMQNAR